MVIDEPVPGAVESTTPPAAVYRNVTYRLAAFWVFGGGCGGAYAATAHDGYSTTPFIPNTIGISELRWKKSAGVATGGLVPLGAALSE